MPVKKDSLSSSTKPSSKPANETNNGNNQEEDEEYEYEEVEVADEEEAEDETNENNNHETSNATKKTVTTTSNNNPNNNTNGNTDNNNKKLNWREKTKKKNFDESDSDLWSEIGLEHYRHPNHRFPPRIHEVSTHQDEFRVIVDSLRVCGIICDDWFAYVEFLCGITFIVIGILFVILWREDMGIVSDSSTEGLAWSLIVLLILGVSGTLMIIQAWRLEETIITFDRKARRIYATTSFLLFNCGSRKDQQILDIGINDVTRISVESYGDNLWYRKRLGKPLRDDSYYPVHLVLRFDPDKNAVPAGKGLGGEDNDGLTNNYLIFARHPYYKAANRIRYWQNYFIEGLGADREKVMSWRKNWVHDIGHTDAEKVDVRVARYWRKRRLLKNMISNMRMKAEQQQIQGKNNQKEHTPTGEDGNGTKKKNRDVVIRYGDHRQERNNDDDHEEDGEEVEEVEEVEEMEEENDESNNNKNTNSSPPKKPRTSPQKTKKKDQDADEDPDPLNESDKEMVKTLKKKEFKKSAGKTREEQASLEKHHRTKLQLLLGKANHQHQLGNTNNKMRGGIDANDSRNGRSQIQTATTPNKIPIDLLSNPPGGEEEGEEDSANNNNKLSPNEQAAFDALLTPRTISAFSKMSARINSAYSSPASLSPSNINGSVADRSKTFFSQVREYHGHVTFIKSPMVLSMIIIPPVLLVLIAIIGTVLSHFDVVNVQEDQVGSVTIIFIVAFIAVIIWEIVVVYYYHFRNRLRIVVDFKKQKMTYEIAYDRKDDDKDSHHQDNDQGGKSINKNNKNGNSGHKNNDNLIEIHFKDLVKVTIGEHSLNDYFTTGEETFIMLYFKDFSEQARKNHVCSVLKSVPLCNIPRSAKGNVMGNPYLKGWENFISHACNKLEEDHDRQLAEIGGLNEMIVVTASPAPLPSPTPPRFGSNRENSNHQHHHSNNSLPHRVTFADDENNTNSDNHRYHHQHSPKEADDNHNTYSSSSNASPQSLNVASPSPAHQHQHRRPISADRYHSSPEYMYSNRTDFRERQGGAHHHDRRNAAGAAAPVHRFHVNHVRSLVERAAHQNDSP